MNSACQQIEKEQTKIFQEISRRLRPEMMMMMMIMMTFMAP
jgi:hypothetical protein